MSEELVTIDELCKRLKISLATYKRLRKEGMPTVKLGGPSKRPRHDYADVVEWLKKQTVEEK